MSLLWLPYTHSITYNILLSLFALQRFILKSSLLGLAPSSQQFPNAPCTPPLAAATATTTLPVTALSKCIHLHIVAWLYGELLRLFYYSTTTTMRSKPFAIYTIRGGGYEKVTLILSSAGWNKWNGRCCCCWRWGYGDKTLADTGEQNFQHLIISWFCKTRERKKPAVAAACLACKQNARTSDRQEFVSNLAKFQLIKAKHSEYLCEFAAYRELRVTVCICSSYTSLRAPCRLNSYLMPLRHLNFRPAYFVKSIWVTYLSRNWFG